MAAYNKVIVMGNLTADPELRQLPSGSAVCEMRMAINERYKSKDGEEKDSTVYVDVVAWGRTGSTSAEYLSKGSPALVEGKLQFDQWEKDGQKRSKIRIRADRVVFMGSKDAEQHSEPTRGTTPSNDDETPF